MQARPLTTHFRLLTVATCVVAALLGCKGSDSKPDDEKAGAASSKESVLRNGFACCNLHYSGDWISDSNLAQLPFIAAGTPIKVKSISGYVAMVEIDGKPMRLGLDFGRVQETTEQWVNKIVLTDDPRQKISKYPLAVREAIKVGKIMKGMSKEQVIVSLGYPQTDETPKLEAPYWRYWWSSFGPYYVYWSGNKISKIDGHSETVGYMTYKGK